MANVKRDTVTLIGPKGGKRVFAAEDADQLIQNGWREVGTPVKPETEVPAPPPDPDEE